MFSFLLVFFANLWIWKIFSFNILLGLLVLVTSILLFLFSLRGIRKYSYTFIPLFLLVLFFQYKTTNIKPLIELSEQEKVTQTIRLNEYPPIYIDIGRERVWIHVAHWFEGRKESIAFFKILKNFSEAVDPNLYFFANHPRELAGVREFEKFPYILLPFFVLGVYILLKQKKYSLFLFSFLAPFFLASLIGNTNPLGPFSLFPFLVTTSSMGMGQSFYFLKVKNMHIGLLILYFLIFFQTIAYEIY